ncbi:MAG: hypothetical protein ABI119_03355 [Gemmatimonadaceae bacterium]
MLHFFQVVVPADAPWWLVLISTVVPLVSGWLAKFLADGLKQILPFYDNSSSTVKLLVSLAIGAAVGFLNTHLALSVGPLGTDLHGYTADIFGAILTALAQSGIYRLDKNKQAAMQGFATKEQAAGKLNAKA